MSDKFQIPESIYNSILQLLNDSYFVETKGSLNDFKFYHDDLWLSDSAVIENLSLIRGEWCIDLIFAHHNNPMKFIKRRISSYSCPKKAALTATLMRRLAAKDQRGTLQIQLTDLMTSIN